MLTYKQRLNVNKWLDELRSGVYIQGSHRLKGESEEGDIRYCCLGVAAESVLNTQFYKKPYGAFAYDNLNGNSMVTVLSREDQEKLGLHQLVNAEEKAKINHFFNNEVADMAVLTRMDFVIMLNDSLKKSFEEIAQFIIAMDWNKV